MGWKAAAAATAVVGSLFNCCCQGTLTGFRREAPRKHIEATAAAANCCVPLACHRVPVHCLAYLRSYAYCQILDDIGARYKFLHRLISTFSELRKF